MFSCRAEKEVLSRTDLSVAFSVANSDEAEIETRILKRANRRRSKTGERGGATIVCARSEELLSAIVIQMNLITCS